MHILIVAKFYLSLLFLPSHIHCDTKVTWH